MRGGGGWGRGWGVRRGGLALAHAPLPLPERVPVPLLLAALAHRRPARARAAAPRAGPDRAAEPRPWRGHGASLDATRGPWGRAGSAPQLIVDRDVSASVAIMAVLLERLFADPSVTDDPTWPGGGGEAPDPAARRSRRRTPPPEPMWGPGTSASWHKR